MPPRPTPLKALCWVAVIIGLIAVTVLALWAFPSLLTRHPRLEGAERHTAIAATRVGIVAFLVALGAGGGLFYTARTYRLTHTGQVTDRYTKAIGQLGDDAPDVRIGAIYALERITKDSPADQPTIMEVLTAYVREHAPIPSVTSARKPPALLKWARARVIRALVAAANVTGWDGHAGNSHRAAPTPDDEVPPAERPAADVQAALTVIARRIPRPQEEEALALRRANLRGASLIRAHLTGAKLRGAHLNSAHLIGAHLDGASLIGADLTGANLTGADLTGAYLVAADLTDATLTGATLTEATLVGANLTGANLTKGALTRKQQEQITGADTPSSAVDGHMRLP